MSSLTSGLSASVSTTSGWTMLALPALAYTGGANILWLVGFLAVGVWLNWTLVAKRLRRYTIAAEDSLTVPEFFERRFADGSGAVRTVAATLTIFFIIFYTNSGLIAGAELLGSVFEIDLNPGIWITLFAVASYTFIGGFLAVSRTDVFQAVLMLAGFIIIPLTLLFLADDPFHEVGGEPGFFNPFTDPQGDVVTAVYLIGLAGWGLGAFGSQRVLQRFMAVESEAMIDESRNISAAWIIGIYALSFLLGLLAHPALEAAGIETTDPEQVYFAVVDHFFPAVIGALLLLGGHRRRHEHGRLPAAARLGGRVERPAIHSTYQRGARHTPPGLAGARLAGRRRPVLRGADGRVPRLDPQPRRVCVGRDGRRLRAGGAAGALLATVQRGGGAGGHARGVRRGHALAVRPRGRPARHLRHHARHARVRRRDRGGGSS